MAIAHTSPLRLDWLNALHKGDCLQIEDLLKQDQGLVTIYPRSGSRQDASDFAAHFDGWRGCSALLVAVKRGWPFLVHTIVNLFKEEPQLSSTSNRSFGKIERRLSKRPSGTRGLRAHPPLVTLSPVAITGASAGAPVGHGDPTPADDRKEVLGRREPGLNLAMLEELLLAFDSDYHLDALALAVVNGNETVVRILARASSKCRNNPCRGPSPFQNPKRSQTGDTGEPTGRSTGLEEDAIDRCATGFEVSIPSSQGRQLEIRDYENLKDQLWDLTEKILGELQKLGFLIREEELQSYCSAALTYSRWPFKEVY